MNYSRFIDKIEGHQEEIPYLRFLLQRSKPITNVVIRVTKRTRGTMIAILPATNNRMSIDHYFV